MKYRSQWPTFILRSNAGSYWFILPNMDVHTSNSLKDIRENHWTLTYRSCWPSLHDPQVHVTSLSHVWPTICISCFHNRKSRKTLLKVSDFIHIFNDFIHVYSPGARAYNLLGTNVWCQQKAQITLPVRCNLKEKIDYIHIFNDFIYVYSLGARADNPLVTNIWCQQKPLSLCPFVAGLKKNALKSRFYIHFFYVSLYMYIAPCSGRQFEEWVYGGKKVP